MISFYSYSMENNFHSTNVLVFDSWHKILYGQGISVYLFAVFFAVTLTVFPLESEKPDFCLCQIKKRNKQKHKARQLSKQKARQFFNTHNVYVA